jgi:leader peptidase (prepilin peptidase)/N-methyltransferase
VVDSLPEWLALAYVAVVGAVLGSFLNVVIARLPAGESLLRPRSHCPRCGALIHWYDNIPILSWLWLRARCRACGARIAVRYPLVELLGAALALALFVRLGLTWQLALWGPLATALLAVVFLDIDHFWVPDVITYPAMVWAALGSVAPGGVGLRASAVGLVPALSLWAFAWIFERLTGREGMGLGDVKLFAVVGLALGALPAMLVLLWASLQGSLIGIVVVLHGGHARRTAPPRDTPGSQDEWQPPSRAVPFGPFLVLGTYEVLLLPSVFLEVPLKLMGLTGVSG